MDFQEKNGAGKNYTLYSNILDWDNIDPVVVSARVVVLGNCVVTTSQTVTRQQNRLTSTKDSLQYDLVTDLSKIDKDSILILIKNWKSHIFVLIFAV